MPTKTEHKAKKKWRPAPDEMVRTFENALKALPEAETRKMFGYPCSFINGQMFAGLHQENMVLRLSEEDRLELFKSDDARPFEPMTGRVMREYVIVPQSILNSQTELQMWLQKAFTYAKSLPPKFPKRNDHKGTKGLNRVK